MIFSMKKFIECFGERKRDFSFMFYTKYSDPEEIGLHIAIPYLFNIFLNTPFKIKNEDYEEHGWGFTSSGYNGRIIECFHFRWGKKYKIIDMPWSYYFISLSYRKNSGEWVKEDEKAVKRDWRNRLEEQSNFKSDFCEVYPFVYFKKDGEKQEVFAECHEEMREWRPKWTRWFPIFRKFRHELWVDFYETSECTKYCDIGEQCDTWKGGVTGCGIDMDDEETKQHALKRIENEGHERKRFQ